jgi:Uma2 family endonuclease
MSLEANSSPRLATDVDRWAFATMPPGVVARRGDLTWGIASLYPQQGYWNEFEFLNLPQPAARYELANGRLKRSPEESLVSSDGEPTWEIAWLFPRQGDWTETQYLDLETNHLIEYRHGVLDFLPLPDVWHQSILGEVAFRFHDHVRLAGRYHTVFAPMPLRLADGEYRTPELLLIPTGTVRGNDRFVTVAHLVAEVVAEDAEGRHRDLVEKRADYAAAGIPEYWIVDLVERSITVLVLEGAAYREAGLYRPGDKAASVLLEGFEFDVTECFAAED